jgi:hypothetical protein
MITALLVLLLAAPQEDDSKRTRGTVLGLPGIQETAPAEPAPAPAPPAAPPKHDTFMQPRQKRTVEDYKALLEHNVFSPPRKKDPPPTGPKTDTTTAQAPKTRKWVMTGIVLNGADQRYEALIEPDDAPKDSRFLKAGDTVAGVTVVEITFDQLSYKRAETPGVLKLRESLSETVAGTGGAEAAKTELPSDADKIRERMKNRNKRESVPDEAEEDAGAQKKPK